jgi:hypothetical protein
LNNNKLIILGISLTLLIFATTRSTSSIIQFTLAKEEEQTSINNTLTNTNNDNNNNLTRFLFVQDTQSGSVVPIGGANNDTTLSNYTLTLNNVSTTIAFSDRPQRLLFQIDTESFVNNWTTGQDSFESDLPNAAIVLNEGNQKEKKDDIIVAELLNPVYDKEKRCSMT